MKDLVLAEYFQIVSNHLEIHNTGHQYIKYSGGREGAWGERCHHFGLHIDFVPVSCSKPVLIVWQSEIMMIMMMMIKLDWLNRLLRLSWNKGVEGLRSPWELGWDYSYQRGACYRKARATQTARGSSQMHLNLILTLHRYQKPIHLTDSSMASSARAVWHCWHWSVPSTRTHTLLEPHDASPGSHLEEGQHDLCPHLGGSLQEGQVGPFHLSWSLHCNPVALTYEVRIIKPQNVQLLELQGICRAPEYMGGGGGYLYQLVCRHVL